MSDCFCWCPDCGGRFTEKEVMQGWGCPKCKSEGIPCAPDKDVLIEVNWHELHILCVWAENWARHSAKFGDDTAHGMPKTVTAIARRMRQQFPDYGSLLLSDEIAELPSVLDKAGIKHGEIETNVPKPDLVQVNGPGAVGFGKLSETAVRDRPWHTLVKDEDHNAS